MNLDNTLKLMYGKCMKAEKKDKDPSSSDDASASDISADDATFYGPNTDMGPAKALDPE